MGTRKNPRKLVQSAPKTILSHEGKKTESRVSLGNANENTPPPSKPYGEGGTFSLLSICVFLLAYKEGLPEIIAPFLNCKCAADFLMAIYSMDTAKFIEIVVLVTIIISSTLAIIYDFVEKLAALFRSP